MAFMDAAYCTATPHVLCYDELARYCWRRERAGLDTLLFGRLSSLSCGSLERAMAFIQATLTWIAYAVVIVLLMGIAAIFVFTYQTPGDRSAIVSTVSIITLTSLLATILLLPVDIALVSSTTSALGRKKDWATPERVHNILLGLKIVYYTLYSLDAVLCLLVAPFTYFLYEEYDQVDAEEGNQSVGHRLLGALKYTLAFVLLVIILFFAGFLVPVAKHGEGHHYDLDYFKRLLTENRQSNHL